MVPEAGAAVSEGYEIPSASFWEREEKITSFPITDLETWQEARKAKKLKMKQLEDTEVKTPKATERPVSKSATGMEKCPPKPAKLQKQVVYVIINIAKKRIIQLHHKD